MRPIRSLVLYFALVFGGGALLAPWLYRMTQWAAGNWPGLAGLAHNPFHRFVVRSILGLAILGLGPLLRANRMLNRRDLGLISDGRAPARLAAGFFIGFGSLACVAALALLGGGRGANFTHSASEFAGLLVGAAVTAIIVAILEELIFRAALFGILRKTCPWPVALVISSAVYAAVHFLQKAPAPEHIGWLSGTTMLPEMLQSQKDGLAYTPAFFSLLVAGMILALAYQRTGSLFMSIGLHVGWIFWLRSYGFVTRDVSGARRAFWGSDRLIDGWLPLLVLTAVFGLMLIPRRASTAKC